MGADENTAVPVPAKIVPVVSGRIGIGLPDVQTDSCDYYNWFVDPATIDGTIYSDSLESGTADVGDSGYEDYILSRAYSRFRYQSQIGHATILGLAPKCQVGLLFYTDGNLVQTEDVPFGSAFPST